MQRTRQKHGRRSYLSVGIGGDSQSLLEREPTRSKDRGLLTFNIDKMEVVVASHCYVPANVVVYIGVFLLDFQIRHPQYYDD